MYWFFNETCDVVFFFKSAVEFIKLVKASVMSAEIKVKVDNWVLVPSW